MSSSSPWYNATPDPTTGKMNAYIGWNTGMNDDNPFDNGYPGEPHGTATLSTEAQGAPGALIMALNFYGYNDNDGSYYSADQMQTLAQELGAENGVTYMITNNSYGGELAFGAGPLGGDADDNYNSPNYLAVISAGNSTYNNDLPQTSEVNYATTIYPAFFSTGQDALTVAATNTGATTLAGFSDYGPESVNVAAPGNTVTAIWGGSFADVAGTSFAGPLAAAVSALVQGYAESEGITLTPEQIIQIVESTVTTSPSLTGQVSTGGEVNAEAAVMDNVPTAPLNAITSSPGQITYGAASGTSVGITVSSVDINASGPLTYSLTNNANGAYQINSSTGVVTVANSADIGDGAFPFQTIAVTASGNTSGGEESASSNLLIKVNSSNFDPSSISGMTLWVNAATANVNGGGAVTSLQDLSGNGETLLPENPLSNGIGIVQHNGVAEFAPGTNGFVEAVDNNVSSGILGSYFTGGTNWTVATAFDPSQITGNATLLQGEASNGDGAVVIDNGLLGEYDNSGGSGFKSSGFNITTLTTGYHALVAVDTSGTIKFYVDGTDVGSVSDTIGVSMGGVESLFNSLSGNQGFATPEIMVYDQAVTSPQVTSLSNYLTEEFSQGSSTGITLPGAATIDMGQTHAFGPTITGGSGTDTLTLADSNGTIAVTVSGGSDTGSGTGSVTITGTVSQLDADTYSYHNTGGSSDTVTASIEDGQGDTVNASQAYTIDALPTAAMPGAVTIDAGQSETITGASVSGSGTLTDVISGSNGTLHIATNVSGGITSGEVSGNNSGTITVTATQSQIDATLANSAGLVYTNVSGSSDTVSSSVTDPQGGSGSGSMTLTIDALPTATMPGAVTIDAGQSETITGASVTGSGTLTDVISGSNDTLHIATNVSGGITSGEVSGNNSGTVTITATQSQIDTTLANSAGLVYTNVSGSSDTISSSVTDPQGGSGSGSMSLTIDALPTATMPGAVTIDSGQTHAFTPTVSGSGTLTELLTDSNGTIAVTGGGTITGNNTGSVTITGTAAQINADSYSYKNTSGSTDTITSQVTDVRGSTASATQLYAVDSLPVNNLPGSGSVDENSNLTISGASVSDASMSSLASYVVSASHGTITFNTAVAGGITAGEASGNGTADVAIMSATITQINNTEANAAGVVYTPTNNYSGSDTIDVLATDAQGGSASNTISITVDASGGGSSGGGSSGGGSSGGGSSGGSDGSSGGNSGGGSLLISGSGEATTVGANYSVTISAAASNDKIILGTGDLVHGFNDTTHSNYFITGSGNDTLNVVNASINTSGGNDLINGVGTINAIAISGSGSDSVHGGDGSIVDVGNGNNSLFATKPGAHAIEVGVGSDLITVRDGVELAANTTAITISNFVPGHDFIGLSQSVGEDLFNQTDFASAITAHLSGNTFKAGHLIINFGSYDPVASDFTLVA